MLSPSLTPDTVLARFDLGLVPEGEDPLPRRDAIAAAHAQDEASAVRALLPEARLPAEALPSITALAHRLAQGVRAERLRAAGVDALMLEFSLDSEEGIALMCLAEALLRIPDSATRDLLIRDKIGGGDWRAHVGTSPSLFVNAAAWGLLVTGRLVERRSESRMEAALTKLLRKGGEPLIRRGIDLAMRLLGRQFVTGRTIDEALANAREREARGYTFSFDMLGEAAVTQDDAARYLAAYENAVRTLGRTQAGRGPVEGHGISVKLSALHPRFVRHQRHRVLRELVPRVLALARLAREHDIGFNIDAEEADRLELSLEVLAVLAADPSLAGWDGLGFVVQAYQKRARMVVDTLVAIARRHGRRLMVRLVKGAYWDTEIKRAQVDGLPGYPVFTRKVHTDVSYLACARAMLAAPDAIYPQFATHNAFTIAAVHHLAGEAACEFQCLHGMGESLYDQVVGERNLGRRCRIYAPVGSHETLLAYLVRRLLENGANSSFVNRIVDPKVSIEDLVADPVHEAERGGGAAHPHVPLPRDLLPDRRNSQGLDFGDEASLAAFAQSLEGGSGHFDATVVLADGHAAARRAADQRAVANRHRLAIRNPADPDDVVGLVLEASPEDVDRAIALALERGAQWSALELETRAQCLERAADLFEAQRATFCALLVREAGRILPDAIGEVRETIDFCRYYATQARHELARGDAQARGPIACISPWNFPLAIFTGQIAAALVAGNPVLAKPAEQTPLVAGAAVDVFHRAGVPPAALQLVPGAGDAVGAALVADPRIAGVMFTGSTVVARSIHRTLLARDDDPVLIAETGGQNAMVADSSALLEQVVGDVLASAFDSAGQRCSALRVLCVQEDVADRVIAMLAGAMRELTLGDPRSLATDVGPVIDGAARDALRAHLDRMRAAGLAVHEIARGGARTAAGGTFVAPALVELGGLEGFVHLQGEVFGPVLHVVRWRRDELPALVDRINATGYALTHGVHTRIDETAQTIVARVKAGNVYVNRNMIGAVVGVQPFGGHGLSGTGPKAGGPLYLRALVRTRTPVRLPSGLRLDLPGPTGERNVLEFRPRGVIACIADDERKLRLQVRAAQAAGNVARVQRSHLTLGLRDGVDRTRLDLVDALDPAMVDAVLLDVGAEQAMRVREQVAAGEGALVPVVVPDDEGDYDLARLLIERTVTINTAAAGGNAALLSVAGE